jgi:hypothetical protein
MEHSDFRPEDNGFYVGTSHGWQLSVVILEQVPAGWCD